MSTFIPKVGDKVKFIADPAPGGISKGKEYEVFAEYYNGSVVLCIRLDNGSYMYFDELYTTGWELV